MKLVKFKDDTYGVSTVVDGETLFRYVALTHLDLWVTEKQRLFKHCKTDKATAEKMLEQLTDRGTVG